MLDDLLPLCALRSVHVHKASSRSSCKLAAENRVISKENCNVNESFSLFSLEIHVTRSYFTAGVQINSSSLQLIDCTILCDNNIPNDIINNC